MAVTPEHLPGACVPSTNTRLPSIFPPTRTNSSKRDGTQSQPKCLFLCRKPLTSTLGKFFPVPANVKRPDLGVFRLFFNCAAVGRLNDGCGLLDRQVVPGYPGGADGRVFRQRSQGALQRGRDAAN